jgi:hypothetical protein
MKFRMILSVFLLFLAILPCIAAPADAALLSISSSGNGVFVLQGVSLADVGGIDATIGYDTATLANPRVVQGGLVSGGMFVANTNSPGVIKIVVISTKAIAGSGIVATVTFDRQGGSAGKILSLSAVMIRPDSSQLPAPQTQVINPSESVTAETTPKTEQPTGTSTTTTSPADTAVTGQGSAAPGTITIPGETGEPPKQQPAKEIPLEQPAAEAKGGATGETTPKPGSPAAQPEGKNIVYMSVLERFRTFKGEKRPKTLTSLFDAVAIPGVKQEPAVALTDGTTRVKVSIQIQSAGKETPNFNLKGAKLISLKPEKDAWVLEALPDRKGYEAAITVMHNGSRTEIPLTVAPQMDAGSAGNLDEAGFNRFLKERGTDKAPRFDLNGDGVRNYLDDYIFTANFIVKRDAAKKASTRMQQW